MKVQRIEIEQQLAQIRVDSQMASLSVEMRRRSMSLEQGNARMQVERSAPDIALDMQEFRDNIGLKSVFTLTRESVAKAQAQVSQSIKKFASNADFIGTLPQSGNPIAQVARQQMLEPSVFDSGRSQVPEGAIKMEGKPGDLQIDWSKQDLVINWDQFQTPVITVEPKASVNVEIAREPILEFTVVEEYIPKETGQTLDTEA